MTENLKHFFEIYYLGFPPSYKETESAINYKKLVDCAWTSKMDGFEIIPFRIIFWSYFQSGIFSK